MCWPPTRSPPGPGRTRWATRCSGESVPGGRTVPAWTCIPMADRIAAIDCGTNSIKILIAELPQVLVRESRMVRLGQGVDTTGLLDEEALARTFAAIDEYAALIRQYGVARLRFCATSATRDARNAQTFTD